MRDLHGNFTTPRGLFFVLAGDHNFAITRAAGTRHRVTRGATGITHRFNVSCLVVDHNSSALHNRCPLRASLLYRIARTRGNCGVSNSVLYPCFHRNKHFALSGIRCIHCNTRLIPYNRARFTGSRAFNCRTDGLYRCVRRGANNGIHTKSIAYVSLRDLHTVSFSNVRTRLLTIRSCNRIVIGTITSYSIGIFTITLCHTVTGNHRFAVHDTTTLIGTVNGVSSRPLLAQRGVIARRDGTNNVVIINDRAGGAATRLRRLGGMRNVRFVRVSDSGILIPNRLRGGTTTVITRYSRRVTGNVAYYISAGHIILALPSSAPRTTLIHDITVDSTLRDYINELATSPTFIITGNNVADDSINIGTLHIGYTGILNRVQPNVPM